MTTIRGFRVSVNAICVSLCIYAGCSGSDDAEKVDCSLSDLEAEAVADDPTDCASNDGSITVQVTGGKAPYKFAINTGAFGSNSTFSDLGAGDFLVRVKDKNGCESTTSVSLEIPGADPLNATTAIEDDTECVANNGSIEVTANGGTAPYEYRIGAAAFGANNTFDGLAPGNYSVAVKDQTGCIFTKAVKVDKGDSGTSLAADIVPIIQANCAVIGCHNGTQSPDFRSIANIRSNAQKIKAETQSGRMPKEGSITASEKARIACWVDEGAKNN